MSKTAVTQITIERTIAFPKYSNEKQSVTIQLDQSPELSLEEKIKLAKEEAELAFLVLYPKYNIPESKEYVDHMNKVRNHFAKKNGAIAPAANSNIPKNEIPANFKKEPKELPPIEEKLENKQENFPEEPVKIDIKK